jgi:hypothetical protein
LTGVLQNRREIKWVVGCSPIQISAEIPSLQSTLPS